VTALEERFEESAALLAESKASELPGFGTVAAFVAVPLAPLRAAAFEDWAELLVSAASSSEMSVVDGFDASEAPAVSSL
jgi:hypothetical protein